MNKETVHSNVLDEELCSNIAKVGNSHISGKLEPSWKLMNQTSGVKDT